MQPGSLQYPPRGLWDMVSSAPVVAVPWAVVRDHRCSVSVTKMGQVLGVSRSGYAGAAHAHANGPFRGGGSLRPAAGDLEGGHPVRAHTQG